ncbi:flagellar filament capping protein FliD [Pararhodospirillum photometricum]|nr:flagellar filament capping protein FliD [Pararhodospirillum photometricum]
MSSVSSLSSVSSTSSVVTGSSGSTYVSGLSGLDTTALIKAAVEAKMQKAYRLDDQMKVLTNKSDAYTQLNTLMTSVSTAIKDMASSSTTSSFDSRAAYLTSSDVSTPANFMSATATSSASLGIYSVGVEQLAKSHKVQSDGQTSSAALGYAGSFKIGVSGGTQEEITVSATMTISDLASAINAKSSSTGVVATLVKVDDTHQRLVLSTTETGKSIVTTDVSGNTLDGLGITNGDGTTFKAANVLQTAQNAIVYVDGIKVESSSNTISNVMPGVSFTLYSETGGTFAGGNLNTINVEVGQDLSQVKGDIEDFVEAYNALRDFIITNQQFTAGIGAAEDAVLFGDSVLKGVKGVLSSLLTHSIIDEDGKKFTLFGNGTNGGIGLSMDENNKLVIDETTLNEALLQKIDLIQNFFETQVDTSSTDVRVPYRAEGMAQGTYTVSVVSNGTSITSAKLFGPGLDAAGVDLTVNGSTLYAPKSSSLYGLYIAYDDTKNTETNTFTITNGFADNLLSGFDTYTNASDGILTETISNLSDQIDEKQEKRDKVATDSTKYESTLINYYARLEKKIAEADVKLQYLEALFFSDDDS